MGRPRKGAQKPIDDPMQPSILSSFTQKVVDQGKVTTGTDDDDDNKKRKATKEVEDNEITGRKRPARRAATKKKIIADYDPDVEVPDDVEEDDPFIPEKDDEPDEEDPSDIEADDLEISKPVAKTAKSKAEKVRKEKKPPKTKKSKKELEIEEPIGKRLSDDPYENSQLNTVANPFFNYTDPNNSRKIGLNLKDKFSHLIGFNQQRLINIVRIQEKLGYNFFHVSLKEIGELLINELPGVLKFSDNVIAKLSFEEFNNLFPLRNSIDITYNLDSKVDTLIPGAATLMPTIDSGNQRHGFVLNCGGLPVDLAWSIQSNSDNAQNSKLQYLAVSLCNTFNISDPRFSVHHTGKNIKDINALQIFEIDTVNLEIKLVRSYLSRFGVISNLKWFPLNNLDDNTIGVLGGIFADGKLRFMKIDGKNDYEFCEIIETSKSFEIPGTRITCFDFISNESVVIGTQNGYIGEIDLKSDTISYVYPLMTRGINIVCSNFADYYHDKQPIYENGEYKLENKAVFVGSIDLQLFVDLNDIRNAKLESLKSKTAPTHCAYSPMSHFFAVNDGSRITQVFSKRDSQILINILKNNSISSSLATSRLHPLVMAGAADGEVHIADTVKRIYLNRKTPVSMSFPSARVFKLEYSSNKNCYRLVTNHVIEVVTQKEYDIPIAFNSTSVCVNSVKWNENIKNANWYAAATVSGLIVIERVIAVTPVRHYNDENGALE